MIIEPNNFRKKTGRFMDVKMDKKTGRKTDLWILRWRKKTGRKKTGSIASSFVLNVYFTSDHLMINRYMVKALHTEA